MAVLSLTNSFFLETCKLGHCFNRIHHTSLNILDEQKNEINKKDFFLGVRKSLRKVGEYNFIDDFLPKCPLCAAAAHQPMSALLSSD